MDPRKLDGTPWGVSDTTRMHAWFRAEALRQLRQRDHDLHGVPLDGRVTQAVKDGSMTKWVVNSEWSKHRSSGADRRALQEKLWTEFCSQPRDPEIELRNVGLSHREDQLLPQARAMQSVLAPVIEQNRVLIEQNAKLLEALKAGEPMPVGRRQNRAQQPADVG